MYGKTFIRAVVPSFMNKTNLLIFLTVLCAVSVYAWTTPNLYIKSITFQEYWVLGTNGTNETWVNVTTIVANALDSGWAAESTTRTDNLLGDIDHSTPILAPGQQHVITQIYRCTTAHTHIAVADYFNVVNEWDETDNVGSVYIDCRI